MTGSMENPLETIGTTLGNKGVRACGLCGDVRRLTKSHVPPQAAGNGTRVERAADVIAVADARRIRRPGRWNAGGLWVRGLCEDCNNFAGRRYDEAYADFASSIHRLVRPSSQRLLVRSAEAPPVLFAPGLVSRCVLVGMFAIHPRLRHILPQLADDLRAEERTLRWPSSAVLRMGLHDGSRALLASGLFMARVLQRRDQHFTFGDIVFPPLAWSLTPVDVGTQSVDSLPDVSDWARYSPERTQVDLRNIVRAIPTFVHPKLAPTQEQWIELMSEKGTDEDAVILHGCL